MRRAALRLDIAIALIAMIVLVIVSPGLAIVGLVAIVVLVLCGLTVLFEFWRSRRRDRGVPPSRRPPARRPPPRRPARRL